MKPTCTESATGLTVSWADAQAEIVVTGVRSHSRDQRVTGELVVYRIADSGERRHVWRTTHNFLSGRSKSGLVKELDERFPGPDWRVMVEQLSEKVLECERRGEPVHVLNTDQGYSRPSHLLEPVLLKGQPTVLFGEGESAKSMMALVFAIVLLLPEKDLGLGLTPGAEPVKVLVLDWETTPEEYGWRLQCLQRGLGVPYVEIPYRRCALPLADDLDAIRRAVAETDAECIVVDSVAGAAGGDLNAAETAVRFFGAIRKLKVSSLLIAHTSKDQQVKSRTIYGSAFFHNFARQVWHAKRESEEGEDEIRVGLFHKKANNTKRHPPLGFRLEFLSDRTTVQRADVRDSAGMLQEMSVRAKILDLLRDGLLKPSAIRDEIGANESTVRGELRRLRQKGLVLALDDGRYGLPVDAEVLQ